MSLAEQLMEVAMSAVRASQYDVLVRGPVCDIFVEGQSQTDLDASKVIS